MSNQLWQMTPPDINGENPNGENLDWLAQQNLFVEFHVATIPPRMPLLQIRCDHCGEVQESNQEDCLWCGTSLAFGRPLRPIPDYPQSPEQDEGHDKSVPYIFPGALLSHQQQLAGQIEHSSYDSTVRKVK